MIQDIAPHRYRNEYNPKPPEKDSIMLCYDGHQVLLEKKGEEIRFPTFAELEKEIKIQVYELKKKNRK